MSTTMSEVYSATAKSWGGDKTQTDE